MTGNQIGIAVLAAFIFYLIAVNRLGIYLGIIMGGGSAAAATSPATTTIGSVLGTGALKPPT